MITGCYVDTHVSNCLTMNDVTKLVVFTECDARNLFNPDEAEKKESQHTSILKQICTDVN